MWDACIWGIARQSSHPELCSTLLPVVRRHTQQGRYLCSLHNKNSLHFDEQTGQAAVMASASSLTSGSMCCWASELPDI